MKEDAESVISSSGWYAYGEFVLDRITGIYRSETVTIYGSEALTPSPDVVRSALRVPHHLTIEISNTAPRRVCALDDLVILESGDLYDLGTDSPFAHRQLAMRLTTYDLHAEDILRLHRIRQGYPEVTMTTTLAAFLDVSMMHLQSLRENFYELELLFARYHPISRWRRE